MKINRKFTTEENHRKRELWLSSAAKGSVLVSPFISPAEKAIRAEAEAMGAKIILITHEAFPDRYKPSGKEFDLSAQGRLLIVAPSTPIPLDRSSCLKMNFLARTIVGY